MKPAWWLDVVEFMPMLTIIISIRFQITGDLAFLVHIVLCYSLVSFVFLESGALLDYEFLYLIVYFFFHSFIDTDQISDQIWMVTCCSYLIAMAKLSYQPMICE